MKNVTETNKKVLLYRLNIKVHLSSGLLNLVLKQFKNPLKHSTYTATPL